MAQKANTVTLGRNFLAVAAFKEFLESSASRQLSAKDFNASKRCYDGELKGQKLHEVTVTEVTESGLAMCTFYARGGRLETLFASAKCLTAIKPVIAPNSPAVSVFSELDRLVSFAP